MIRTLMADRLLSEHPFKAASPCRKIFEIRCICPSPKNSLQTSMMSIMEQANLLVSYLGLPNQSTNRGSKQSVSKPTTDPQRTGALIRNRKFRTARRTTSESTSWFSRRKLMGLTKAAISIGELPSGRFSIELTNFISRITILSDSRSLQILSTMRLIKSVCSIRNIFRCQKQEVRMKSIRRQLAKIQLELSRNNPITTCRVSRAGTYQEWQRYSPNISDAIILAQQLASRPRKGYSHSMEYSLICWGDLIISMKDWQTWVSCQQGPSLDYP